MIKLSSTTGGSSGIENPPESLVCVLCLSKETRIESVHTRSPLLFFSVTENTTIPS